MALGFFRSAACPPVGDQEIGKIAPLLLREDCHQVLFDHDNITGIGKTNALCKPTHVCVDCDPLVSAKRMVEHDVCGFPANTGDLQELFHGLRHRASGFRQNGL